MFWWGDSNSSRSGSGPESYKYHIPETNNKNAVFFSKYEVAQYNTQNQTSDIKLLLNFNYYLQSYI